MNSRLTIILVVIPFLLVGSTITLSSFTPLPRVTGILVPQGGFIAAPEYVTNGVVVTSEYNVSAPPMAVWGTGGSLSLTKVDSEGIAFDVLNGTTGSVDMGFTAGPKVQRAPYLALVLDGTNESRDAQVTFSFQILGSSRNYSYKVVYGPLLVKGWSGDTYYQPAMAHTSQSIDLAQLLAAKNDHYLGAIGPDVVVSNNLTLEFRFRVSFDESAFRLPSSVIPPAWVQGNSSILSVPSSTRILFYGMAWYELSTFVIPEPAGKYYVANSSSNLLSVQNSSGSDARMLEVSQQIQLNHFEPWMVTRLDVASSIAMFKASDWLFLVVMCFLVVSLALTFHSRNATASRN